LEHFRVELDRLSKIFKTDKNWRGAGRDYYLRSIDPDQFYSNLLERYNEMSEDWEFRKFKDIRDKVFAHFDSYVGEPDEINSNRLYYVFDSIVLPNSVASFYQKIETWILDYYVIVNGRHFDLENIKGQQEKYVEYWRMGHN
jgi:hypothetical protein